MRHSLSTTAKKTQKHPIIDLYARFCFIAPRAHKNTDQFRSVFFCVAFYES